MDKLKSLDFKLKQPIISIQATARTIQLKLDDEKYDFDKKEDRRILYAIINEKSENIKNDANFIIKELEGLKEAFET